MVDQHVLGRMRRQHGLISRSQALDEGMTGRQIERLVRSGVWEREASGVYRHEAVPSTVRSRLLALCMAHGAVASHRSAAALHPIEGYRLDRVEVVVPPGRARGIRGARRYESSQMDLFKPVERDGILCTPVGRTVLDLAAIVDRRQLDRTVDAVLRDGQLRLSDLYGVLASHARRGRRGCDALRASLEDRFDDNAVPLSDWSRMVADLLVDAGLEYPALEHRVRRADGGFVAQVDLAFPSHRVAIELDSARWHDNRESFVRDRRRRNEITLAGWTVLNFTWSDYTDHPAALCEVVAKALATSGANFCR
ncbi:MAG: type IV toxin-antitoxin system AbiEi family antitoxin domain-containing protein [Acidimicrobiaceae bacterium]|nr:type IV toxin-antitoxin system AbiEi family antitoxin domain-containing protein [Acidimicrobiaceae bacterium]MDE0516643.1 type IV toxin-antitoxin system AbiEi family antitoxin domain-containing protein [Acidimicrobiaceae bacterium]MDE0655525.1 type IV toxin-antitoxin system AbiEi family antitoxin domain-containing protein [Acidimicrobiaceae bacterium]